MAIAVDNTYASGLIGGTGNFSQAFTCSGSNRILFVQTWGYVDQMTDAKYGGVAMTQIGSTIDTGESVFIRLWYLVNPASGSNNITVTWGGNGGHGVGAISFTGARQLAPTVTATGTASGTDPIITTVTTVSDNSWAVLAVGASVVLSASTNTIEVANLTDSGQYIKLFRSNGAITPAGNYSMTVTGGNSVKKSLAVAFSPIIAANLTETISLTEQSLSAIKRFVRSLSDTIDVIQIHTFNLTETITASEPYLSFKKGWKNITKNISNWTNQNKN